MAEGVISLVESLDFIHQRCRKQFAIEPIRPTVIRAANTGGDGAHSVIEQPRTAVTTNVVEGTDCPVITTHDND